MCSIREKIQSCIFGWYKGFKCVRLQDSCFLFVVPFHSLSAWSTSDVLLKKCPKRILKNEKAIAWWSCWPMSVLTGGLLKSKKIVINLLNMSMLYQAENP